MNDIMMNDPGEKNTALTDPVLRIEELRVHFSTRQGPLLAIGGVSLELAANEVVGIVGESGSGKTLTGLSVLGLEPPGAKVSGHVWFRGEDLRSASVRRLQQVRGASIAMIFQEPMTALNPSLTVGTQVAEVVRRHQGLSRQAARSRALDLFELVRLPGGARHLHSYPHQLSGGMRQRAMIAMAIACDPAVLIADEPTTALDPTIQAQILELLRDLRASLGMAVLLVTHNLAVVRGFADRVFVMYAGHVLEEAPTDRLYTATGHPYTAGLLGAVPQADSDRDTHRLTPIPGQVPLLRGGPEECVFSPRCPYTEPRCLTGQPSLRPVGADHAHLAACVLDGIPEPAGAAQ
jgi:oligopeptide/dipeptide ABC transporter ATP-binding protein